MKLKTVTLTQKQREKMLVRDAYHDGFRAACEAMRRVFAPEHKAIRKIINGVDHVQGDPSMLRFFRSQTAHGCRDQAGRGDRCCSTLRPGATMKRQARLAIAL